MPELTPKQKRKLLATADIVEKGDVAVLEKILEYEDERDEIKEEIASIVEEAISKINEAISSIENGKDGRDGVDGRDGRDGRDGKDADENKIISKVLGSINVPDKDELKYEILSEIELPENGKDADEEEIVKKIENNIPALGERIRDSLELLEGENRLDAKAIKNLPQMTQTVIREQMNVGGFETPIIAGSNITVTKNAQGKYVIAGTASGGGHTIQDEGTPLTQRTNLNFVGAGVTVTDDSGNDATVVTISTSAGAGYQAVTSGSVNGSNTVFTWATAPNAISVDGVILRKTASDTTVNWTGTTTTTLTVAPNFDIFGVA